MNASLLKPRKVASVIGAPIDVLGWTDALVRLGEWSAYHESRYVCICNVHSVVTAAHDPVLAKVIAEADMATPDGAPVAWMLRRLGHASQQRINGPDLMWRYCAQAQDNGDSIFLYGSSESTLVALQKKLLLAYPALNIAGAISPPFRKLTGDEESAIVAQINTSGAGVVFVGLGCPKQELWMAQQRGRIQAVMVGVGAAFDYHAGVISRAPLWMQHSGLEWLHRLASEPRRLWKRYLTTNTVFIFFAAKQLLSRART